MFEGTFTAIITPFNEEREINYDALKRIVEFQVKNGISGIVPVGSTGESATLSHKEHSEIISFVCEQVNKRVPVIAGTGSNSTVEAINLTTQAEKDGAAASLQVCPYYNKPTQEGLYQHFKAIAEAVNIPIIVYNIPGRTGRNIEVDTISRLSEISNIAGVKEASGSIVQIMNIIHNTPDDFIVLSGDDIFTLPVIAAGGKGVISVSSNIAPQQMCEFVIAGLRGDFTTMRALQKKMLPLFKILTIEQNPIPVKAAAALKGLCEDYMRSPLCSITGKNKAILKESLTGMGIL